LEVATSFASRRVTRVLEQIVAERGQPLAIRCDNGPQLTSRHFLAWCVERQIELVHIQPGKPTQNAHVESFHGRMREECLNVSWFQNLLDARRKDRGVAEGVQRGTPAQPFRVPGAEGVRYTDEGGFGRRRFAGFAVLRRKPWDGKCRMIPCAEDGGRSSSRALLFLQANSHSLAHYIISLRRRTENLVLPSSLVERP
jgi:transposase InsO family protein